MLKLFRDKGYCVSDLKVLTVSCPITMDGNQERSNGFLLTIPDPLMNIFRTCKEKSFGNKEMELN